MSISALLTPNSHDIYVNSIISAVPHDASNITYIPLIPSNWPYLPTHDTTKVNLVLDILAEENNINTIDIADMKSDIESNTIAISMLSNSIPIVPIVPNIVYGNWTPTFPYNGNNIGIPSFISGNYCQIGSYVKCDVLFTSILTPASSISQAALIFSLPVIPNSNFSSFSQLCGSASAQLSPINASNTIHGAFINALVGGKAVEFLLSYTAGNTVSINGQCSFSYFV